jgi:hypothetical protein
MSDTGQGTVTEQQKAAQYAAQAGGMPSATVTSEINTGVPSGYSFKGRTKITDISGQERDFYDIRKEANTILSTMNDATRKQILTGLKSKNIGYSPSQKVGNGFSDADRNAFSELLLLSNVYTSNYETTYKTLMRTVPTAPGSYKAPRVTATDDVYAAVQQAAQSMLGRNLSDDELREATTAVQRAEIRAQRGVAGPGGSVQQMPSLSSLAAKQVEQEFGAESDEMQYLGFAELMNKAVSTGG